MMESLQKDYLSAGIIAHFCWEEQLHMTKLSHHHQDHASYCGEHIRCCSRPVALSLDNEGDFRGTIRIIHRLHRQTSRQAIDLLHFRQRKNFT